MRIFLVRQIIWKEPREPNPTYTFPQYTEIPALRELRRHQVWEKD